MVFARACQKLTRVVIELLDQEKPSRREPGRRVPVRSFRFESWAGKTSSQNVLDPDG